MKDLCKRVIIPFAQGRSQYMHVCVVRSPGVSELGPPVNPQAVKKAYLKYSIFVSRLLALNTLTECALPVLALSYLS